MEFFGVDLVELIRTVGYAGVWGIVFAETGLFLGFLDSYKKSETPQGREYIFKVSGANFYGPPRMTPANSF